MTTSNRQWILARRPTGLIVPEDFEYRESAFEAPELAEGQVLVKNIAFLCAPTMRNWMDPPGNNLYPCIPLDSPVLAPSLCLVVESADPAYPKGCRLATLSSWQDYEVIEPVPASTRIVPEHHTVAEALGPFGLNAMTGYFGIREIGNPQPGESVLVSGAAGSAGSAAAQVAKHSGCRVVGIAGGPEKASWLKDDCGLDACIDYKNENVAEKVAEHFPDGIDIFFDNVGGEVLQVAVENMAPFGRIVLCGQISGYNEGTVNGPGNMMRLIYGGVRMQGFLVNHFADEVPAAIADLERWERAGEFKHKEDLRHGFEDIPMNFNDLFLGKNSGTLIVQISD